MNVKDHQLVWSESFVHGSLINMYMVEGLCWTDERYAQGHFTHEPRAVTMMLREPKRKCPKAVPTHLQHHVVWSQVLKCSVKSYATGLSTKCYFNE